MAVEATEAARQWIDPDHSGGAEISNRHENAGRPDQIVACPLTFNTANKIARGVMDNRVTGMLCDGLGARASILAVPFVNDRLWRHPAWSNTVDVLVGAGVVFLDAHDGQLGEPVPVRPGTGDRVVGAFDPAWIVAAVGRRSSGSR